MLPHCSIALIINILPNSSGIYIKGQKRQDDKEISFHFNHYLNQINPDYQSNNSYFQTGRYFYSHTSSSVRYYGCLTFIPFSVKASITSARFSADQPVYWFKEGPAGKKAPLRANERRSLLPFPCW